MKSKSALQQELAAEQAALVKAQGELREEQFTSQRLQVRCGPYICWR